MRKFLIVDVNGLGYASMYQPALAHLSHNGESTAGVNGAISSVISMMKKYPQYTPIVLWDGHAKWRYDLNPDYKSNREDDAEKISIRESYKKQVPHIKRILMEAGIPQIIHPDCEADDLAGMICAELAGDEEVHIVMGTKDTDWWQGISDNAEWYSNLTKITVTAESLQSDQLDEGPFDSPDQYIKAKALAGDTSDVIAGVPGIGLKTAAKIIRDYGSVEALWDKFDAGEKLTGERLLKVAGTDYRALYKANLLIMDWRLSPPICLNDIDAQYKKADHMKMQSIGMEFGMMTLSNVVRSAGVLPDYMDDLNFVFEAIEGHTIAKRLKHAELEKVNPTIIDEEVQPVTAPKFKF